MVLVTATVHVYRVGRDILIMTQMWSRHAKAALRVGTRMQSVQQASVLGSVQLAAIADMLQAICQNACHVSWVTLIMTQIRPRHVKAALQAGTPMQLVQQASV